MAVTPRSPASRWLVTVGTEHRSAMAALRTVLLVAAGGVCLTTLLVSAATISANGGVGIDASYYRSVGERFLTDGTYYRPGQLAGPYDVALMLDVLYPPTALLLFVPLDVLPIAVWWIIPLAVTGYCITRWRPAWWGVVAMLLLLAWPRAHAAFLYGNTDMWAMAAVAAGLTWGWPAVFLTLKPTFAPLALVGIRHRSWWVAAAGMFVFFVATLPLWHDYVVAMTNLRIGADYSIASLPLLAVPVVAWSARVTRS